MVNGVDVNDNIQGTPNNLFIEDAIQETTRPDQRHLGRVRPLLGRRRQRRHAQRRQLLQRQLPRGPEQPVVDRRRRRSSAPATSSTPTSSSKTHEGTFGGPVVARPPLVLRRRPLRDGEHAQHVRAERRRLHAHRHEPPRRAEVHRHDRADARWCRSASSSNATEQANISAVGAAALLDASTLTTRAAAEPAVRRQLQRHDEAALLRDAAVLAEAAELPQQRRHQHGDRRLAVPDAGRARGRAGRPASTTRRTSTRPTRSSGTTVSSPAASRRSLSTERFGSHELKGGARVLREHGHRRQLAVVDRLASSSRTT